jgi:hypothetical protein
VSGYKESIKEVLAEPVVVIRGYRGERKAVGRLDKTHLGPKYLVVVYREPSNPSKHSNPWHIEKTL